MAQNNNIDPRVIKVSFQINGKLKTYSSPMYIKVSGTKYANSLQNEANVVIANIDNETQDYLLTETTPYNLNFSSKTITIEAGRESYGTSVIFIGNIVSSLLSQPPDIGITLKCMTGNFLKSKVIGNNLGIQSSTQQISANIAQILNVGLQFEATNKIISNYNFSGSALGQIGLLNGLGGMNAYIDDNTLVVKNSGVPLNNTLKIVSSSTGMIGIPEFTEQGIKVKFLLDNRVILGGAINIQSNEYRAANGSYVIYKLGFDIATRDVPFYYIAEAARIVL